VVEPLRDHLGGAVGVERDAVQHARDLHRPLLVGDDQDLRLRGEALDELQEPVQVHIVQRGLDLVHQVEGRGTRGEDREQERHRGERALAARQQRDTLHALAAGTRLDLDPRRERVGRIGQDQPALTAGEQLRDQPLELLGDIAVRRRERLGDLPVDLRDHLEQVPARLADVVELPLHEVVALLKGLQLAGRE